MNEMLWQNPANVPVPQTGWGTIFLNALDGGNLWLKRDATTWEKIEGSGGGGSYIEKTLTEMQALALASDFVQGATYKITDVADGGVFVQALDSGHLSDKMFCLKRVPAVGIGIANMYIDKLFGSIRSIGVWRSGKSVSTGNYCVWGGRVWQNLTGAIGTDTSVLTLDSTNWKLQTTDTADVYETVQLECVFDIPNGKMVELSFGKWFNFQYQTYTDDVLGDVNNLDYCDIPWPGIVNVWGLNVGGLFVNNKFYFDETDETSKNMFIKTTSMSIYQNDAGVVATDCTQIYKNSAPIIANDKIASIYGNSGQIQGNSNCCVIGNNTNDVSNNVNCQEISDNDVKIIGCMNFREIISAPVDMTNVINSIYPAIEYADLPDSSSRYIGQTFIIVDADTIAYNGVAVGGGTGVAKVWFNGTDWVYC